MFSSNYTLNVECIVFSKSRGKKPTEGALTYQTAIQVIIQHVQFIIQIKGNESYLHKELQWKAPEDPLLGLRPPTDFLANCLIAFPSESLFNEDKEVICSDDGRIAQFSDCFGLGVVELLMIEVELVGGQTPTEEEFLDSFCHVSSDLLSALGGKIFDLLEFGASFD